MKRVMLNLRIPPFNRRVAASLLLGLLVVPGTAANKTWDVGGADSFWQTGFNWNANTAPFRAIVDLYGHHPLIDHE
jgi:hypothetical protein